MCIYCAVEFDWDPPKASANRRKHGVDFADAGTVFHDERAIRSWMRTRMRKTASSRLAWTRSAESS